MLECSCQGFNTLTVESGVLLATGFGRCSLEHLVLGFYGLVSLNAIRMCVCVCVCVCVRLCILYQAQARLLEFGNLGTFCSRRFFSHVALISVRDIQSF